MLKTQGTDLIETFRSLAPYREPITIQRWSRRRIRLALGALVGGLLALGLLFENITGGGFV